jgi:hypothetical protein
MPPDDPLGPPDSEFEPSDRWIVCGSGSGFTLYVYVTCLRERLPVCGDGTIDEYEMCESTDDCVNLDPDAVCTDCRCTNFCGDGIVTWPEQCEEDDDCAVALGEECRGCICEYDEPFGDD